MEIDPKPDSGIIALNARAHTNHDFIRCGRPSPSGLRAVVLGFFLLLYATANAQADESCGCELAGWRSMTVHVITLTDGQDAPLAIEVRIADEHDERTAGYQY
ncbi:MAG: hypothetical protein U9Q71_08800, partial [Pseudomonadota bacterium]|nr:hypothetical protein [Pseudomonadota bacterium]